ncbi:MAG: alcohol dehydrogenase, partial [Pseudonocardia sp.]|nr:alcohol dehydrogenase [Pseudonocardia sp.]
MAVARLSAGRNHFGSLRTFPGQWAVYRYSRLVPRQSAPPYNVGRSEFTDRRHDGRSDSLRRHLAAVAAPGWTLGAAGGTDVALPLLAMYSRGLTFRTGRVHARAVLPAVLDVLGSGFDQS